MPKINIEVVCAYPDKQVVVEMECVEGVTIEEAIKQSEILSHFPELAGSELSVGVHGFRQTPDFQLSNHDRVEIYRPLLLSPTQTRRLRAKAKKYK